jgi:hypothetical protein
MFSSHSCPAAHRHHTATCIFGVAVAGVSPPLRSCNHIAATCGYASASDTPNERPTPVPLLDLQPGSSRLGPRPLPTIEQAGGDAPGRTAAFLLRAVLVVIEPGRVRVPQRAQGAARRLSGGEAVAAQDVEVGVLEWGNAGDVLVQDVVLALAPVDRGWTITDLSSRPGDQFGG